MTQSTSGPSPKTLNSAGMSKTYLQVEDLAGAPGDELHQDIRHHECKSSIPGRLRLRPRVGDTKLHAAYEVQA